MKFNGEKNTDGFVYAIFLHPRHKKEINVEFITIKRITVTILEKIKLAPIKINYKLLALKNCNYFKCSVNG